MTTHRVQDGELRLRTGGSGPPLLLLHGNPQTHAMWHAVAPRLADRFTIVAPDLRGYGGPVNSGHYLAEEAPEDMLAQLGRFLQPHAGRAAA